MVKPGGGGGYRVGTDIMMGGWVPFDDQCKKKVPGTKKYFSSK